MAYSTKLMNISALTNKNEEPPILIIDKIGIIGEALAHQFSKEHLIVFLSEKLFSKPNSNILHIPFKKKIPEVPDNEYSKIFIIDDGTSVTRESAFSFVNKALENNAPLYFIGSIRNVDVEHADDIVKSYKNSKILVFGDLFDNALIFDKNSTINKYIYSVRNENKIEVSGNGLSLNFPITFADTIKLIIKATELELTQKIILLFSGTPITDIALAKEFKIVKPLVKIESSKQGKNKKVYIPNGSMHALSKYDLHSRIESLNLNRVKAVSQEQKKNIKKQKFGLRYLLAILIFVLIAPLFYSYLFIFVGSLLLNEGFRSISQGNEAKAISLSKYATFTFNLSGYSGKALEAELNLLHLSKMEDYTVKKITIGKYLSSSASEISASFIEFEKIYNGGSDFPRDSFNNAANLYRSGMADAEKAQALENFPKDLLTIFNKVSFASEILNNSPEGALNLLGFESEKRYLVLILDNKYISPVGGKIASLKIISIKEGKIVDAKDARIEDFSSYDGKPLDFPFFIERYAGVKTLSLPTSIYKIDFSKDASDVKTFYQSSNSVPIDGVIAIDQETLKLLTENNFVDSLKIFGDSIKNKKILIISVDQNLQKVIDSKNWGGGVYDNRQNLKNVVNDFFGIVETNIDSKANNNLISKTVSKKLKLSSEGSLSSVSTIAIKNGDDKDYKSYIQLLLPLSAKLTEIKINGVEQKITPAVTDKNIYNAKTFNESKGLEVYEEVQNEKKTEGFVVNVSAGGVKTIIVTYQLSNVNINNSNSFEYSLGVYKQPGVNIYTLDLDFDIPSNYQIIGNLNDRSLIVDYDKTFSLSFSQK